MDTRTTDTGITIYLWAGTHEDVRHAIGQHPTVYPRYTNPDHAIDAYRKGLDGYPEEGEALYEVIIRRKDLP